MKYIVTWIIINTFLVPCNFEPKLDEYGRLPQIDTIPAVACWETTETKKEKMFKTLKEAELFIKKGKEQSGLKGFTISKILDLEDQNEK